MGKKKNLHNYKNPSDTKGIGKMSDYIEEDITKTTDPEKTSETDKFTLSTTIKSEKDWDINKDI